MVVLLGSLQVEEDVCSTCPWNGASSGHNNRADSHSPRPTTSPTTAPRGGGGLTAACAMSL